MEQMRSIRSLYEKANECSNAVEMLRNMAFRNKWTLDEENTILDTADMIRRKEELYRRQASEIEQDIFAI